MSRKKEFAILLSVGIITLALLEVATTGLNSKDVLALVFSTVVLCFMLRGNK